MGRGWIREIKFKQKLDAHGETNREDAKNMAPSFIGGKAEYMSTLNLHIFWGCRYPPPKPQLVLG